jgi:hypothetical protein
LIAAQHPNATEISRWDNCRQNYEAAWLAPSKVGNTFVATIARR